MFTFQNSKIDLIRALKSNEIKLLGPFPKKIYARKKVSIQCLRCGNKLSRHRKKWAHQIWYILNNKVNCSRCKAKNQTCSKKEAIALLKDKGFRYVSGDQFFRKSKLHLKCVHCKEEVETNLDKILNADERSCACNQSTWRSFESLVRQVYQGEALRLTKGARPDCVLLEDKIIIDAKYGRSAFYDFKKRSNSRLRQIEAYLNTGYELYFVCSASKDEIPKERFHFKVKYLFYEDLLKVRISGRKFSKSQMAQVDRMKSHPWEYSKRSLLLEYEELRKSYMELIDLKKGVCPSTKQSTVLLKCSWQRITDAFGVPDKRKNASQMIAEYCSRSLKISPRLMTHEEYLRRLEFEKLDAFVKEKYNGKVIMMGKTARDSVTFKCKIARHPCFRKRRDKVFKKPFRWCPKCKNLKKV